ncbi:hypothetical protein [Phascolarctobacterium sp.]
MLVKELIEKLKEMPQDALIVVPGDGDFYAAMWVTLDDEDADHYVENATQTEVVSIS